MTPRAWQPTQAVGPAMAVLAALTAPASAYTYRQVGVDSNFLTVERRVHFAQSDGSLTVLDLERGEVLRRLKNPNYSGALQLTDHGKLRERAY